MLVNLSTQKATKKAVACYHCGEICPNDNFSEQEKQFCCQGCLAVYDLLKQNQLCEYYNLNDKAGIKQKVSAHQARFDYLDLPEVQAKLFDFNDSKTANLTFFIPNIHCSSCIWLLENLYKLNENIVYSRINFLKKQLSLSFDLEKTKLSEIVALLASIGYEPQISLNDTEQQNDARKDRKLSKESRKLIAQIAVAGFVFGNVMMLSFPEYFGFDSLSAQNFKYIFNVLNVVLSLPVLFFSGQDYIISAYKNLRKGLLHVDFPLALGILVLWIRSLFEIFTETGAGYIDSMSGLIFFLLVGKWFQNQTYETMRYDRDFKSYFPVAVMTKTKEGEKPMQVADLQVGSKIIIRNEEIIPADAILWKGKANIDYSFVTGEAKPTKKTFGDLIYAGGRQKGDLIELEVLKPVSQSYLTQLWNNESNLNKKEEEDHSLLQAILNRYFTLALLVIASISALYWLIFAKNIPAVINAFSSVLIVACPCALSLGSQFALGTAMRILGNHHFYLKNIRTVEKIAENNTIVFDKTGTITETHLGEVSFVGYEKCQFASRKPMLSSENMLGILKVCQNSTHPLSVGIYTFLKKQVQNEDLNALILEKYEEFSGKGIEGVVNGTHFKMGSREFIMGRKGECTLKPDCEHLKDEQHTKVFLTINFVYQGFFSFHNSYKKGLDKMMQNLDQQKMDLHLISGDHEGEKDHLSGIFPKNSQLHFNQNPHEKLTFIKNLQAQNRNVMMVGDGLNDAGALLQSNTGIAVTENTAYFTPASDAILDGAFLIKLPRFIAFCKHATLTIRQSFAIAILYNLVGLYFAVQGELSPVIAAILMPVSSITVILFTTFGVKRFEM